LRQADLEVSTQTERLAEGIAESVLSGEFPPGLRLDEHMLAERYGVSRTPVREALRQLASTGLIEVKPRRGATVANATSAQLETLFAAMAEIEAVLMGHPEILECAVIGVPDAKWGETVKAVVVRRSGTALSETTLIEWSRDKLAGFKRPRSVDFVEALPRNASGKILKRTLREPYWANYERRVN